MGMGGGGGGFHYSSKWSAVKWEVGRSTRRTLEEENGLSERLTATDKDVVKRGEVEKGRTNQTCGGWGRSSVPSPLHQALISVWFKGWGVKQRAERECWEKDLSAQTLAHTLAIRRFKVLNWFQDAGPLQKHLFFSELGCKKDLLNGFLHQSHIELNDQANSHSKTCSFLNTISSFWIKSTFIYRKSFLYNTSTKSFAGKTRETNFVSL